MDELIKKASWEIFEAINSNNTEAFQKITDECPNALFLNNKEGLTPATMVSGIGLTSFLKIIAEKAPQTFSNMDNYGWTCATIATGLKK